MTLRQQFPGWVVGWIAGLGVGAFVGVGLALLRLRAVYGGCP